MSPERTCPDCDATLPTDAPRRLCPECLMDAGLSRTSTGRSATTGSFEPAGPGGLATIRLRPGDPLLQGRGEWPPSTLGVRKSLTSCPTVI
jgi:hypothetical protein